MFSFSDIKTKTIRIQVKNARGEKESADFRRFIVTEDARRAHQNNRRTFLQHGKSTPLDGSNAYFWLMEEVYCEFMRAIEFVKSKGGSNGTIVDLWEIAGDFTPVGLDNKVYGSDKKTSKAASFDRSDFNEELKSVVSPRVYPTIGGAEVLSRKWTVSSDKLALLGTKDKTRFLAVLKKGMRERIVEAVFADMILIVNENIEYSFSSTEELRRLQQIRSIPGDLIPLWCKNPETFEYTDKDATGAFEFQYHADEHTLRKTALSRPSPEVKLPTAKRQQAPPVTTTTTTTSVIDGFEYDEVATQPARVWAFSDFVKLGTVELKTRRGDRIIGKPEHFVLREDGEFPLGQDRDEYMELMKEHLGDDKYHELMAKAYTLFFPWLHRFGLTDKSDLARSLQTIHGDIVPEDAARVPTNFAYLDFDDKKLVGDTVPRSLYHFVEQRSFSIRPEGDLRKWCVKREMVVEWKERSAFLMKALDKKQRNELYTLVYRDLVDAMYRLSSFAPDQMNPLLDVVGDVFPSGIDSAGSSFRREKNRRRALAAIDVLYPSVTTSTSKKPIKAAIAVRSTAPKGPSASEMINGTKVFIRADSDIKYTMMLDVVDTVSLATLKYAIRKKFGLSDHVTFDVFIERGISGVESREIKQAKYLQLSSPPKGIKPGCTLRIRHTVMDRKIDLLRDPGKEDAHT